MPSFIRLFVMNRVLTTYISTNGGKSKTAMLIRDLTNSKNMDKYESKVCEIMVNLAKYGIKHYMEELYDEETQASIIEQIFNQMILKQFKKEYQQVTTYSIATTAASEDKNDNNDDNNDNYHYQCLVFNTTDLMCSIFQFLSDFGRYEMKYELVNCSLVNSHWLYHTWNPNSIYFAALFNLIRCTVKFPQNELYSRMWQRFYNAQKVYIYGRYKYSDLKISDFVLNKLGMYSNIRNLDGFVSPGQLCIIKVIVTKCGNKIERFSINTFGGVHSLLKLLNVKFLAIGNTRIFSIWTNKCEQIELNWVENIKEKWCEHVIDKCDCSGVKSLSFARAAFDEIVSCEILKKFAQKFVSLEHLVFEFYSGCDEQVLLLWSYLNSIIVKNTCSTSGNYNYNYKSMHMQPMHMHMSNSHVHVKMQIFTESTHFEKINDMIEKNKIIIDYIRLIVDGFWEEHKTGIRKLLSNEKLEWLQLTNSDESNEQFPLVLQSLQNKDFLKKVKFDTLKRIEFQDNNSFGSSTMKMINQFLQLNLIVEKKLFIIAKFIVKNSHAHESSDAILKSNFDASFEKLCKNIVRLMMKDKIAIDIKVTFEIMLNDRLNLKDSAIKTFQKHFGADKIMRSYQAPQCNKFCIGLQEPVIFFGMQDDWEGKKKDVLRVATVETCGEMYS